jgi:hypothetical protein
MKTLISAIALLVGSNLAALAADQTLKLKLVAFNVGEKDGEYHMVGVIVSPDGTLGTKKFPSKRIKTATAPQRARSIISPTAPSWRTTRTRTRTRQPKPVATSSAKSRSFPARAPIRARPAQAHLKAIGATRVRSKALAFITLNWT